ncbi:MAG: hypothetical protein GX311_02930 [Bacteroidales bacterium]|jgi:hypothetical protein|nr:hypothetical protein [Bacteroidales bacterium]
MKEKIETLLCKINKKQIWDEIPVFCFTSDVDWASEDVMSEFFDIVNVLDIKPTLFVTHESKIIDSNFKSGKIERGIHPNFLENSSHGNSFREVIETCIKFAPESYVFRSHRFFDVTDITHLLKNEYNYKYFSNMGTIMQSYIRPILHESGLINIPVFFEDGTHLYNQLDLDFKKYLDLFVTPGIKIISFHPMNLVFNSPNISFMRQIKDTLTREEFNNITFDTISKLKNREVGIGQTIIDIVKFVKENNYPIMSLNEIYYKIIGGTNNENT